MTNLITRRHNESDGEAHALRRYIAARAASREHPEWSRFAPDIGAYVGCTEIDAEGRDDGLNFRRLRRPGMPWCSYLGADTTVAEDAALQAFFEHHAAEPHDWNRLRAEVSRDRKKCLRDWRRQGREILLRARADREGIRVSPAQSPVLQVFLKPGTGGRSLKRVKRD